MVYYRLIEKLRERLEYTDATAVVERKKSGVKRDNWLWGRIPDGTGFIKSSLAGHSSTGVPNNMEQPTLDTESTLMIHGIGKNYPQELLEFLVQPIYPQMGV